MYSSGREELNVMNTSDFAHHLSLFQGIPYKE